LERVDRSTEFSMETNHRGGNSADRGPVWRTSSYFTAKVPQVTKKTEVTLERSSTPPEIVLEIESKSKPQKAASIAEPVVTKSEPNPPTQRPRPKPALFVYNLGHVSNSKKFNEFLARAQRVRWQAPQSCPVVRHDNQHHKPLNHLQFLIRTNCKSSLLFFHLRAHFRGSILVYPPDSPGAVNITNADLNRLQPGEFLNDTLIEFGLKSVVVMDDLKWGGIDEFDQVVAERAADKRFSVGRFDPCFQLVFLQEAQQPEEVCLLRCGVCASLL
jgi:hypothetical protein